jgi:excisionase family DNA binding protein
MSTSLTKKPIAKKPRLIALGLGAERLGVNERTLRRYIAAGLIRGYKVGPRLVRVDLDELEALPALIPSAGTSHE